VRLQAIEYLHISGLVIDFATSPVRTGNNFFCNFSISLHSAKFVNLSFGLRPKIGPQTKLWSQSLVAVKD